MVKRVNKPNTAKRTRVQPRVKALVRGSSLIIAILAAGAGAQSAEFGLSRERPIELEQSKKVDFEFVESHSPYLSEFGVLNLDTNEKTPLLQQTKPYNDGATASGLAPFVSDLNSTDDYLGTPGETVLQPNASFVFEAGSRYTLYLKSSYQGQDAGTAYLLDELHGTQSQLALVDGEPEDLCTGKGNLLLWDDTGSLLDSELQQDRDFDDFVVNVRVWCNLEIAPVQTTAQMTVSGPSIAVNSGSFAAGLVPVAALAGLFATQPNNLSGGGAANTPIPLVSPSPTQPPNVPPTPDPQPKDPLTPTQDVPEPSSLLGIAIAGSGWAWYHRHRRETQRKSERN